MSGEPDEHEFCSMCGTQLEWVQCYECGGEGDFDANDEDPVNFAPGEEYETCQLCRGRGGWLDCPASERHEKE